METTSVILIVTISNMIIQPLFQFILHSRCTEIQTPCMSCIRSVKTPDNQENAPQL